MRSQIWMAGVVVNAPGFRVVVFGAGKSGELAFDAYSESFEVVCFVDNSPSKIGSVFCGLPVVAPSGLGDLVFDKIIIASVYYYDINEQLLALGFDRKDIYIAHPLGYEHTGLVEKYSLPLLPEALKVGVLCEKLSWFGLAFEKLHELGLPKGVQLFPIDKSCLPTLHPFQITQDNYRDFTYEGVQLYEVVIYSVCVELEIYENKIEPDNPLHLKAIEFWYNNAATFIDHFSLIADRSGFDKFVIPQGYFVEAEIVRRYAIPRNIPVIALEITFRKDKLLWEDVSGIAVNRTLAHNFFWRTEDFIDENRALNYMHSVMSTIGENKAADHSSPSKSFECDPNKPMLLYLGQVYTDASVLFGLIGFSDPVDVVEALVDYSVRNSIALVLKLHPKEATGSSTFGVPYRSLTWRKIQERQDLARVIEEDPSIHIDCDNSYDTYDLIGRSDAVVTINSQSGFEALALGKEVVLCGHSFYSGLGFTSSAYNGATLCSMLDLVLEGRAFRPVKTRVAKFFYSYFENYCIEKDERSFLENVVLRGADR